jgi:hypothetical protein
MRSRLGIAAGFTAVAVVGVLAFALFLALHQTPKAWSTGVSPAAPVVTLKGGQTVCQKPLDVPRGGSFDRVRLTLGTFRVAGPGLDVFVKGRHGATLAHGVLGGGYPDVTTRPTEVVGLDHRIGAGTEGTSVCIKNGGPGKVALYGNGAPANGLSAAFVDGRDAGVDLDLVFERKPHSYLSELGTIAGRAVLFRSPRFGEAGYIIALILLVGIAFGGVALALRATAADADER